MRRENLTIALLSIIAVALVAIAVEPIFAPRPAEAQSGNPYPLYIEPGSEMLRTPDGSNPGLRQGDGGHAHRENLGLPDKRATVLSQQQPAEQAARLASVRAGKVRV